ncbi:pentapeptide repeat-containing protein [Nonomuraea sp. MTCD27]|uniref:pentapeptide repeat-containing protein n=1 Tax=Nonomuraea sp. MTCD27 TaxID=1676747 RepID=UPI0035BFF8E3
MLGWAELRWAELRWAELRHAVLVWAELCCAMLRWAELTALCLAVLGSLGSGFGVWLAGLAERWGSPHRQAGERRRPAGRWWAGSREGAGGGPARWEVSVVA